MSIGLAVLTQTQLSDMVQVSDLGSDCCEERAVGEGGGRNSGGISPFSYVQPMPAEHGNSHGIHLRAGQTGRAGDQPSISKPEG